MTPKSRLAVLLFTDIVGSTHLKTELGTERYAKLLAEHNRLFEADCATLNGQVLKHTGDGYFAAFETSSEAVRAALDFQHGLRKRRLEPELRVRIGIHVRSRRWKWRAGLMSWGSRRTWRRA
jgi:class 3 adenylate cyclase